jgi:hypothetical protein
MNLSSILLPVLGIVAVLVFAFVAHTAFRMYRLLYLFVREFLERLYSIEARLTGIENELHQIGQYSREARVSKENEK